jgi:galactokinase
MIDLRKQLSPVRGLAANYLLGVAQQFIETGELVPNLDVAVTSTVPIGAGLSSSAALEVAFATLLEQALETPLEPVQKALLCQRAEHAFPGAPVGIMDMLVSIQAEAGAALLIDCRSNQSQPVLLPPSEQASVLIVDTRRKHSLASGEYGLRRAACERAAKKLGVRALRDATLQMLQDSKLTGEERRRALHVVAENTRTILAAQALASRDLPAFGGLMFASHESLRDLFEVSCEELDVLVECAAELRDQGVFGARMTGGGFGGCIVALCETGSVDQIAHALSERFRERFDSECTPMIVRAAPGARILDLP